MSQNTMKTDRNRFFYSYGVWEQSLISDPLKEGGTFCLATPSHHQLNGILDIPFT